MKKSAIEFTKKNQSVTYLVFSLSSMALVGYFTIALKPLTVRGEKVSNAIKERFMGSGMVVFLVANEEESLLSFYQDNKFRQFDTRLKASNTTNQHKLVQLLRLL